MEKRVSLKDIAQKVGVSTALVSYVLNNQKENRISKEIARKIRDTAQALNYRPNQIAKSLKTRKTLTIGLVVADIANPFFSTLARIIEDEAEKNRYTVIFGSSDETAERSQRLIDVLLDRQVDGLILAPTENSEDQIRQLQERNIPFVLIDRYFPALEANYVGVNNHEAAYQCGLHLLETGRKRIGFIGFQTTLLHLQDRKKGFLKALQEGGVAFEKKQCREVALDATHEEVEESIQQLLKGPGQVDAIFFASNKLSTIGLKYINRLPVTVPTELALCSFDQSDATDLFYAPLTYVRQPLEEMGQSAVRILLQAIEKQGPPVQLHLPASLVLGLSS
ncbi:MAG TPA: substrate-binding domain-containing protein [Flavisolibacter sp.]|jgi:LacI family transcriptional regulator|nr:substrate-binding domain-containing protein [Flavisolibacter sp.]